MKKEISITTKIILFLLSFLFVFNCEEVRARRASRTNRTRSSRTRRRTDDIIDDDLKKWLQYD